jgi:hypothetical protein
MALGDTGPDCHRPLIEIDLYGDRLIGCVECNGWSEDDGLPMKLKEEDITALRGRVRPN